jgi:hypothetical protein
MRATYGIHSSAESTGSAESTTPMDPHEAAVQALKATILATLEGTSKLRFQEAQKLCVLAHSLEQMRATRVADFPGPAQGGPHRMPMVPMGAAEGWGVQDVNVGGGVVHPYAPYAGPADQQEVLRNFAQTVGPGLQIRTEADKAALALSEAQELETLHNVLEHVTDVARRAEIMERIATLFTKMRIRNDAPTVVKPVAPVAPSVARPVV